jgi:lysophospholipase L1-like esterase
VASLTLPATGAIAVERAVTWRCDRTTRRLAVSVAGPDGTPQTATADIRTPSCRGRLAVALRPARPRARRPATVQIIDRWGIGSLAARVCTSEPGGQRRRCRRLRFAAGQVRAAFRFHPARWGRYPVIVEGPAGPPAHRVLIVRPATRRLRVLATGDSMIQIIDGELQRRLAHRGAITVRSDAHISTGISKPFAFDWIAHARGSARTLHPDVTVMFVGANDGFPMGTPSGHKAPCCDDAWVAEYARRARRMMRAYARGGAATVYWLLLPTPRGQNFRKVFRPVNRALRAAARSFPGVVHLVDLGATFTPGGKFRQLMRWEGRTVSVRQADGVHLSIAGASIATTLITRRMHRDGLIE